MSGQVSLLSESPTVYIIRRKISQRRYLKEDIPSICDPKILLRKWSRRIMNPKLLFLSIIKK